MSTTLHYPPDLQVLLDGLNSAASDALAFTAVVESLTKRHQAALPSLLPLLISFASSSSLLPDNSFQRALGTLLDRAVRSDPLLFASVPSLRVAIARVLLQTSSDVGEAGYKATAALAFDPGVRRKIVLAVDASFRKLFLEAVHRGGADGEAAGRITGPIWHQLLDIALKVVDLCLDDPQCPELVRSAGFQLAETLVMCFSYPPQSSSMGSAGIKATDPYLALAGSASLGDLLAVESGGSEAGTVAREKGDGEDEAPGIPRPHPFLDLQELQSIGGNAILRLCNALQDNPSTRVFSSSNRTKQNGGPSLAVASPWDVTTMSDLLSRLANLGYTRPFSFSDHALLAICEFGLYPPLHLSVSSSAPAQSGGGSASSLYLLVPCLRGSLKNAITRLLSIGYLAAQPEAIYVANEALSLYGYPLPAFQPAVGGAMLAPAVPPPYPLHSVSSVGSCFLDMRLQRAVSPLNESSPLNDALPFRRSSVPAAAVLPAPQSADKRAPTEAAALAAVVSNLRFYNDHLPRLTGGMLRREESSGMAFQGGSSSQHAAQTGSMLLESFLEKLKAADARLAQESKEAPVVTADSGRGDVSILKQAATETSRTETTECWASSAEADPLTVDSHPFAAGWKRKFSDLMDTPAASLASSLSFSPFSPASAHPNVLLVHSSGLSMVTSQAAGVGNGNKRFRGPGDGPWEETTQSTAAFARAKSLVDAFESLIDGAVAAAMSEAQRTVSTGPAATSSASGLSAASAAAKTFFERVDFDSAEKAVLQAAHVAALAASGSDSCNTNASLSAFIARVGSAYTKGAILSSFYCCLRRVSSLTLATLSSYSSTAAEGGASFQRDVLGESAACSERIAEFLFQKLLPLLNSGREENSSIYAIIAPLIARTRTSAPRRDKKAKGSAGDAKKDKSSDAASAPTSWFVEVETDAWRQGNKLRPLSKNTHTLLVAACRAASAAIAAQHRGPGPALQLTPPSSDAWAAAFTPEGVAVQVLAALAAKTLGAKSKDGAGRQSPHRNLSAAVTDSLLAISLDRSSTEVAKEGALRVLRSKGSSYAKAAAVTALCAAVAPTLPPFVQPSESFLPQMDEAQQNQPMDLDRLLPDALGSELGPILQRLDVGDSTNVTAEDGGVPSFLLFGATSLPATRALPLLPSQLLKNQLLSLLLPDVPPFLPQAWNDDKGINGAEGGIEGTGGGEGQGPVPEVPEGSVFYRASFEALGPFLHQECLTPQEESEEPPVEATAASNEEEVLFSLDWLNDDAFAVVNLSARLAKGLLLRASDAAPATSLISPELSSALSLHLQLVGAMAVFAGRGLSLSRVARSLQRLISRDGASAKLTAVPDCLLARPFGLDINEVTGSAHTATSAVKASDSSYSLAECDADASFLLLAASDDCLRNHAETEKAKAAAGAPGAVKAAAVEGEDKASAEEPADGPATESLLVGPPGLALHASTELSNSVVGTLQAVLSRAEGPAASVHPAVSCLEACCLLLTSSFGLVLPPVAEGSGSRVAALFARFVLVAEAVSTRWKELQQGHLPSLSLASAPVLLDSFAIMTRNFVSSLFAPAASWPEESQRPALSVVNASLDKLGAICGSFISSGGLVQSPQELLDLLKSSFTAANSAAGPSSPTWGIGAVALLAVSCILSEALAINSFRWLAFALPQGVTPQLLFQGPPLSLAPWAISSPLLNGAIVSRLLDLSSSTGNPSQAAGTVIRALAEAQRAVAMAGGANKQGGQALLTAPRGMSNSQTALSSSVGLFSLAPESLAVCLVYCGDAVASRAGLAGPATGPSRPPLLGALGGPIDKLFAVSELSLPQAEAAKDGLPSPGLAVAGSGALATSASWQNIVARQLQEITSLLFVPPTAGGVGAAVPPLFSQASMEKAVKLTVDRCLSAAGNAKGAHGAGSASSNGCVVPLLFMRVLLLCVQHYPDSKGLVLGSLTRLLRAAKESAFEPLSAVKTSYLPPPDTELKDLPSSSAPPVPVWDGLVVLVRQLAPFSFPLLACLPSQEHVRLLLTHPKLGFAIAMLEKLASWLQNWEARGSPEGRLVSGALSQVLKDNIAAKAAAASLPAASAAARATANAAPPAQAVVASTDEKNVGVDGTTES